jgi:hypothetical protein
MRFYTVFFKTGTCLYVRSNSVKAAKREAERALGQPKGSAVRAQRGRA